MEKDAPFQDSYMHPKDKRNCCNPRGLATIEFQLLPLAKIRINYNYGGHEADSRSVHYNNSLIMIFQS